MNKTLKLVFLASIVLNVLMLGVLLGRLPHRFERAPSRQERMENSLKEFPEPVRARFRVTLDRLRQEGESISDQIQEGRNKIFRIIVAEPFDETAYDRQINKVNELRMQRSVRIAKIIKDTAKELPPDQRKMLAEMLKRAATPRPPRS